jgi:hypothetical protein
MHRAFVFMLSVTSLGIALIGQTQPPAAAAAPIIENAFVKVMQFDLPPQSIAPVSAAPGNPVLVVRLRSVPATTGSTPQPASLKFEIVYYVAGPNALSGALPSGARPARDIAIEFKSLPPAPNFVNDAVTLDPAHNSVLFENALFRVVEVHFGLGEKGPVVDKRPRVIILLTDMHAQVMKPGGAPEARDGKSGTIQWSLGGSQATMNRNETPLDNIVVELKGK